jgi:hypothetical protein
MKKKLPILKTDKEAEDFIDNADLTEYDLSALTPITALRASVYETANGLYEAGLMDKCDLQEFDKLCLASKGSKDEKGN